MRTIKAIDYAITPIYTQDVLHFSTKLGIEEDGTVIDINNGNIEVIVNNRDVRDLYRKGKEESLAYTLLRPFIDSIMSTVKTNDFEWKDFLKSNERFIPYLVDVMIDRIKEVMDLNSRYYGNH